LLSHQPLRTPTIQTVSVQLSGRWDNSVSARCGCVSVIGLTESVIIGPAFTGTLPNAGIPVTFTAPAGPGASAIFPGGVIAATVLTNAFGRAYPPPPTANSVAGMFSLVASAGTVSTPIGPFVNAAGTVTTLSRDSPSPNPSTFGQPVWFSANVEFTGFPPSGPTGAPPSYPEPAGSVLLQADGVTVGAAAISDLNFRFLSCGTCPWLTVSVPIGTVTAPFWYSPTDGDVPARPIRPEYVAAHCANSHARFRWVDRGRRRANHGRRDRQWLCAHLGAALFIQLTGVQMAHIPYRGGSLAIQSVMAGDTQVTFGTSPSVLPQVNGGKLLALAVSTRERSQLVPGLPGMREAGLPEYNLEFWYGIFVPVGTPPPIVKKIYDATVTAMQNPSVKAALAREGTEVALSPSPEQFSAFLVDDDKFWVTLAKNANLKLE
jgi:Tripartite tricarboxylate transporter family receptor